MKKLLVITIAILFALPCLYTKAAPVTTPVKQAKAKKVQTKHKIEFTTKDKFILGGNIYLANPKTDKPLVVALHSFSLNGNAWATLAEKLRLRGYNVLAMDLRGHGKSIYNENLKVKTRYNFTYQDWQKLPKDVVDSINYVKSNYPYINCNDIIIVGADIGASAGILAGGPLRKQPLKIVMISPMANFKGLYIPSKVVSYTSSKFMILLSQTDKILFNFNAQTKPIVKEYPLGGSGNQLLKANPQAVDDIVNFIVAP